MSQTLYQFLRDSDYAQHLNLASSCERKFDEQVYKYLSCLERQLADGPQSYIAIMDEYVNFHWVKRSIIAKNCIFWDCLYLLILKKNMPYPFRLGQKSMFFQYVYKRIQTCTPDQYLKDNIIIQLRQRKRRQYSNVKLSLFTAAIQSKQIDILITAVYVINKATQKIQTRGRKKKNAQPNKQEDKNQGKQSDKEELFQPNTALQIAKEQYEIVKIQPTKTVIDKERQRVVRRLTYDLSMVLESLLVLPQSQTIQGNYYTIINPLTLSSQTIPLWKIIFQCRKAVFDGKVGQQLQLMQKYTNFLKIIYRKQFQQMMLRDKQQWQEKDTSIELVMVQKDKAKEEVRDPQTKEKKHGRLKKLAEKKDKGFNSAFCKDKTIDNNKTQKHRAIYDRYDDNLSESDF